MELSVGVQSRYLRRAAKIGLQSGAMDKAKELWWRRLQDAKLRLDQARVIVKDIEADKGAIPPPDGSFAYTRALHAENLALSTYREALQAYYAAAMAHNGSAVDTDVASPGITPREREVLKLIAAGKTSKEIAAELGIAFRTTVCHRYRLYQKLKVDTNVE